MKFLNYAFSFFNYPRNSGSIFLTTVILHKHIALFTHISKNTAKVSLFCRWENSGERWGACLDYLIMSNILYSAHSLVHPNIAASELRFVYPEMVYPYMCQTGLQDALAQWNNTDFDCCFEEHRLAKSDLEANQSRRIEEKRGCSWLALLTQLLVFN